MEAFLTSTVVHLLLLMKVAGVLGVLALLLTPWGLTVIGGAGTLAAALFAKRASPIFKVLLVAAVVVLVLALTYRAGAKAERGKTVVAIARAVKAEADAKALAVTAQANADSAKALAADNEAQALAYAADAERARSDADEIELARQAAAIAARSCPPPRTNDPVHRAIRNQAVGEDDDLAPSMRAAMEALRGNAKGRRR